MFLLFFVIFPLASATAARAQAQTGDQKPEALSIHHEGIIHVKELPPAAQETSVDKVIPRKFPHPEHLRQKKEELRHEQRKSAEVPGSAPQFESTLSSGVSIGTNFIGLRKSESGNFIPPDTQVAAGPNHIFEVVNTEGRILMKDGTVITTFNLNTFFGVSKSTFLTDPKIRFDTMTGRWFVMAITLGNTTGAWQLAISTSSDPTGSFFHYSLITTGIGPDFPAIGWSDDKIALTANAFDCVPTCISGSTPLGTMFVVLKKADVLVGSSTPNFEFFAPDQGLNTIQPAHSLSSTSTLFMAAVASISATSVRIWSVTGVPDGLGGGVTSTTTDLTINTLSNPPDAVQMGTLSLVETNDNDLLDAVFRDGSLWVAATSACQPGEIITRSCLRFIEILTGSMTKNQDFDFGTTGTYYYYPAIQIDSANNLIAVFSRSSASEFASVYASGRLTTDTLNTLQAPVLIKAGEAPYGADRWGDYSGAGIDPSDLASVWVGGEYARVEGGSAWGTWIAQIGLGAPGFTLSAIKAGNGTGVVTITSPGPQVLTCDSSCAGRFASYTTNPAVTLGAVADADAIFTGWTGDPDCADGQVTMNANKSCTATFLKLPDLTGQIVLLTRTTSHGKDKLKFTLLVQNIGSAPATGDLVVRFFLSDDATFDGSDLLVTEKTVKGKKIIPGGVEIKGKATTPSPSQGKFIIGVIDATNTIAELDEGNNITAQPIP